VSSSRPRRLAALALLVFAHTVAADGPGSYSPAAARSFPEKTQQERAIDAYNEGYEHIQRADDLATRGANGDDKAAKESQKTYKAALKKFSAAVKLDPTLHEAFTYIGYANRKLGKHEESLAAYKRALELYPDYPPAIEYQGEAFLGLNDIDAARTNYLRLYALDQGQAHKLLRAMKDWAVRNAASPPDGVDVAALRAWVAERESAHDLLKAGW